MIDSSCKQTVFSFFPTKMTSNSPLLLAAQIARQAKKMQLEEAIALVKRLREDYKVNIQAVKDERERICNNKAAIKAAGRFYKNNASNRKLNRVGEPIPSKKKQQNSNEGGAGTGAPVKVEKPKTQRYYADNDANRKLGRAGQPIPQRKKKEATNSVESEVAKPEVVKHEIVEPEVADVESMSESDDDDGFSDSDSF